eukprot:COSAG01_NODE_2089_length_8454_cov_12.054339_4_plen_76_part_00
MAIELSAAGNFQRPRASSQASGIESDQRSLQARSTARGTCSVPRTGINPIRAAQAAAAGMAAALQVQCAQLAQHR